MYTFSMCDYVNFNDTITFALSTCFRCAGWKKNDEANTLVLTDPMDHSGMAEAVDVLDKALYAGWFATRLY